MANVKEFFLDPVSGQVELEYDDNSVIKYSMNDVGLMTNDFIEAGEPSFARQFSWATLPAPADYIGTAFITDVGLRGSLWRSDGAIWGGSGIGIKVIGNTIARPPGSTVDLNDCAIRIPTSNATSEIRNNLIVGWNVGIRRGALTVESNNSFWNVGVPVQDAAAATISPAVSDITIDPKVNSKYVPLIGSPLIAAGLNTGYTRDVNSKQRPRVPTIGAYDIARLRQKPIIEPI